MAVTDLWHLRDGETRSLRYGRGLQWQVRVPGHPSQSFRTKKAAQLHEAKLLASPKPLPGYAGSTVEDLLDAWIAGKKGLSRGGFNSVHAGYMRARNRWGDYTPDQVLPYEVQTWAASMTVSKTLRDGQKVVRPAGRDTKIKAISALSGALEIAIQRRMITANPCTGTRAGRSVKRDPIFLDVGQLRALAEATMEHCRAMTWFLGTTGVRIGECCALNVENVSKRQGKWRARVRQAKSGRGRDVPIPESVANMLHLDRPGGAPLFTTAGGGRIDKDNWRARIFKPAGEALGVAGLRPHDLRHTAASLMILSGATVKDVQAALGHSSAKMTLDLYAGWWDDGLDDVSDRMNSLIGETSGNRP